MLLGESHHITLRNLTFMDSTKMKNSRIKPTRINEWPSSYAFSWHLYVCDVWFMAIKVVGSSLLQSFTLYCSPVTIKGTGVRTLVSIGTACVLLCIPHKLISVSKQSFNKFTSPVMEYFCLNATCWQHITGENTSGALHNIGKENRMLLVLNCRPFLAS